MMWPNTRPVSSKPMPGMLLNRKKEVRRKIIIVAWVNLCVFSFGVFKWGSLTHLQVLAKLTCPPRNKGAGQAKLPQGSAMLHRLCLCLACTCWHIAKEGGCA